MLNEIGEYLDDISSLVLKIPSASIQQLAMTILEAYRGEKRVFIFGNGGGSATSVHFACDLAKGTVTEGKPRMKVISLAENVPLITAWANDTDYTNTFGEQLKNLVEEGDVVIGLSGSGMSPNVINAFKVARDFGALPVLLSGFSGGIAVQHSDMSIVVPSEDMQQIEDVHLILCHIIFRMVRNAIRED